MLQSLWVYYTVLLLPRGERWGGVRYPYYEHALHALTPTPTPLSMVGCQRAPNHAVIYNVNVLTKQYCCYPAVKSGVGAQTPLCFDPYPNPPHSMVGCQRAPNHALIYNVNVLTIQDSCYPTVQSGVGAQTPLCFDPYPNPPSAWWGANGLPIML